MENLGKVLKLKETAVSVHQTAEYQKLTTQEEEEENEDDSFFIKKNVKSKNNKTFVRNKKKETSIDSTRARHNDMNGVMFGNVTMKQSQLLPSCRTSCGIILLIIFATLSLVVLHLFQAPFAPLNWSHEIPGFETSSNSLVLADVDGDGLHDVVVFVSASTNQSTPNCSTSDSCGGKMVAMRGIDGLVLWSASLTYQIMELRCGMMEEKRRCVGVVEGGRLVTIDIATGEVLWLVSHQLEGRWAGIGVVESGDHLLWFLMQKNNFHETANRSVLVMVDTLTGSILNHVYHFPHSHWLSFAPISINDDEKDKKYLLFGFHGINSTSEVKLVELKAIDEMMTKDNLSQEMQGTLLLRSNNDCHTTQPSYSIDPDNITIFLISCHANMTFINLKKRADQSGAFESTTSWGKSVPHYAPQGSAVLGHFNEDQVRDVFVQLVKRAQQPSHLLNVQYMVLDGRDGGVLWSENSSYPNAYLNTQPNVYHINDVELHNKMVVATKVKGDMFMYWQMNIEEYGKKTQEKLKATLKECSGRLNISKRSVGERDETLVNKTVPNGGEGRGRKTDNKYDGILGKLHAGEGFLKRRRTNHNVVEENQPKPYDLPFKSSRQQSFFKPGYNVMTFGGFEKARLPGDEREYSYNNANYEYDYDSVGRRGGGIRGLGRRGFEGRGVEGRGVGRRWRWYDELNNPAMRKQPPINLGPFIRPKEDAVKNGKPNNHFLSTQALKHPPTWPSPPLNTASITPTTNENSIKCSPIVSSYSLWGVTNSLHLPIFEIQPLPPQLAASFLTNSHQQSISNLSPSTNHSYCISVITTDVIGHMAHLDGREASLVTVHTVSKASHDQNGAILRVFKKVVVSKSHPVSNYDPTYSLTLSSDNPDIPEESFCAMVTSPIYKMVVSAKSVFLPYTSHLFQSSFFSPSLPQSVQDYISGSK